MTRSDSTSNVCTSLLGMGGSLLSASSRDTPQLQSVQRNNVTRSANNIKNNPRKLSTMQPPHKDCVKWRYPEDFGLRTRKEIYEFRPTHARGIYVIVDENMVICFLKAAKQMRFFTMPEWPYHGRKG